MPVPSQEFSSCPFCCISYLFFINFFVHKSAHYIMGPFMAVYVVFVFEAERWPLVVNLLVIWSVLQSLNVILDIQFILYYYTYLSCAPTHEDLAEDYFMHLYFKIGGTEFSCIVFILANKVRVLFCTNVFLQISPAVFKADPYKNECGHSQVHKYAYNQYSNMLNLCKSKTRKIKIFFYWYVLISGSVAP